MKKRNITLFLTLFFVASAFVGAGASELVREIKAELRKDFVVKVDGDKKDFKNAQGEVVYPILFEGTTYLPVRAIGELMGKVVYWYEDDKRIELRDVTVTDADVIVSGEKKDANVKKDDKDFIGEDKAKAIALEKAGFKAEDVLFGKVKLDEDDGIWKYEVEFVTGQVEYEVDIGAVNGAILKWEVENEKSKEKPQSKDNVTVEAKISADEAKKIALEKAGFAAEEVSFVKAELDKDGGKIKYEIEFKKDGIEYEAEIDAETGTIIKWETEKDGK